MEKIKVLRHCIKFGLENIAMLLTGPKELLFLIGVPPHNCEESFVAKSLITNVRRFDQTVTDIVINNLKLKKHVAWKTKQSKLF